VPKGSAQRDEMRPITALFADIVGSTGLGERLGPDEVKALVGECVTRMSRAVEEFGGVIQAYMGDGICAYFGVPAAHEDDPERAARAALRILGVAAGYAAEVEQAWSITGFNVRVGVNSGPAAVGVVGEDFEQIVALGDATNVAARLQSAAEPGTIAIGEVTAKRLEDRFVLEPLGEIQVKGRAEPVITWRLVGPRPPSEPRPATPLVGRQREVATLEDAVEDLAAGRGQVLLLPGEAGLGKTRMLSELRARVGDRATWLEGRCVSYGTDVPYGPFVGVLRAWTGVEVGEPELAVRTKLRARAGALLGPAAEDLLPYLGLMLGIRPAPEVERDLLTLPADELTEQIRGAYLAWVGSLASARPLAIAVDDLQWGDRTTRELAERLLHLTERVALLLAVTLRPDPSSEAWTFRLKTQAEFAHRAVEVPLPPLSPEASRQLIDALVPPGLLTDAVKDELVVRAEGNPLYVEELLRALLEAGGHDRHRTWTITPGSTQTLPPALEALLVARVDRLPAEARRLAQVAAVVGREFSVDVAAQVAGIEDADADLSVLLRAEVVRELRRFPELECTFRHGLLQEAVLSTLTPTSLRELYGQVGAVVEERTTDAREDHAEQLAFYFYRSDEHAKALRYLERAAERAEARGALHHAAELWARSKKAAARAGDAEAERLADERLRTLGAG
jgi:class 3 adenylate cyclase